jgi:catechol 2,3-dioxygenase-like lactoylglutathione lyase family enzyme
MSGRVLRLARVGRNVGDLARMIAFYRDALDFVLLEQGRVAEPAWGELMGLPGAGAQAARLRLGAQELELVAFDPPGRPYPAGGTAASLGFQHLAIVVSDMPAAYARLCRHAFEPISEDGPQTLPPNTGAVTAFKFRDPEGHPLELIQFPAGVGAPGWQQAPGLFLGIDHSAIVVADATASTAFYAPMGWHVAGRSHNRGPAQDRLDGLRDADVEVVGLEPVQGGPPHLELLGYRVAQGRHPPAAANNDLVGDRLVLAVDELPSLLARLPTDPACSPTVRFEDGLAALRLDPDGHRLLLWQPPGGDARAG